jgi:hypothetical protein
MFIITTDGLENASREYFKEQIKEMIREKEEKCGWEFLFLASNIDAVSTADSIGIKKERAVNYVVENETVEMYKELGDAICAFRTNAPVHYEKIEENIKKRKTK